MGTVLQFADYTTPAVHEFHTANGEFALSIKPEDLQYLPRAVAIAEEWLRGIGFPNVRLVPVGPNPFMQRTWGYTEDPEFSAD